VTTPRTEILEPEPPPCDEEVTVPTVQATPADLRRDEEFWRVWRQRLLPFMAAMTAVFAIFFLFATAMQLNQLQERVDLAPKLNVSEIFAVAAPAPNGPGAPEVLRWHALAALEDHALALRYHQANVLLISRVWTSALTHSLDPAWRGWQRG
jgi:hypothetical protein